MANASAAAGMVIGGIMLTGLGGKFTSLVFAATGGQSGLCLSMVAIVCIILGMGMPVPGGLCAHRYAGRPRPCWNSSSHS